MSTRDPCSLSWVTVTLSSAWGSPLPLSCYGFSEAGIALQPQDELQPDQLRVFSLSETTDSGPWWANGSHQWDAKMELLIEISPTTISHLEEHKPGIVVEWACRRMKVNSITEPQDGSRQKGVGFSVALAEPLDSCVLEPSTIAW